MNEKEENETPGSTEPEKNKGWLLLDPGRPILTVLDGLFRYGNGE